MASCQPPAAMARRQPPAVQKCRGHASRTPGHGSSAARTHVGVPTEKNLAHAKSKGWCPPQPEWRGHRGTQLNLDASTGGTTAPQNRQDYPTYRFVMWICFINTFQALAAVFRTYVNVTTARPVYPELGASE